MGLRAHVTKGRLIVDEPTTLPEGTVLDLVVDDEGDELDPTERAALHAAIKRADQEAAAGDVHLASDVIKELRSRR